MALILQLNRDQYFRGQVTRFLGDQWLLNMKVVNQIGDVAQEVDLTGGSATAHFPAASGGDCDIECELSQPDCGGLLVRVPTEVSAELETGETWGFVTLENVDAIDNDGPVTVQTPNPDLNIVDRDDL